MTLQNCNIILTATTKLPLLLLVSFLFSFLLRLLRFLLPLPLRTLLLTLTPTDPAFTDPQSTSRKKTKKAPLFGASLALILLSCAFFSPASPSLSRPSRDGLPLSYWPLTDLRPSISIAPLSSLAPRCNIPFCRQSQQQEQWCCSPLSLSLLEGVRADVTRRPRQ